MDNDLLVGERFSDPDRLVGLRIGWARGTIASSPVVGPGRDLVHPAESRELDVEGRMQHPAAGISGNL